MNRPIYETAADRAAEREVARWVEREWGLTLDKTEDLARHDYTAKREGQLYALIEIKCRRISWGTYPTLIIATHKIDALVERARAMATRAILVVGMRDCICWHAASPPYRVVTGGRTDRNDPADIEHVYDIPFDSFARRPV